MPNVIKEAGAMGTPILASDVGGIPELLNHGINGTMFKSGDLADLNVNLQNILDNYQMALEKAKYLFDYVTDKYDINKNSRVLADIYKKEITY